MPAVSRHLDAVGVAIATACLGHSLAVPSSAWSVSGHLVFALALVPVAAWTAVCCRRSPRRRRFAWVLAAGAALTVAAAPLSALGLAPEAVRAVAALGALGVVTGHLARGHRLPHPPGLSARFPAPEDSPSLSSVR
ncbi:MAG: hypothetical protein AAFQ43_12840 [Bacteroidota bacterium]